MTRNQPILSSHMKERNVHRKTARRGIRVGIATAAVAVIAALGFAAPASAAPVVDPNALGSITVHKFEKPESPTGLPNNGTEVGGITLDPLAGIEFTIKPVQGIDLATNSGWVDAGTLANSFDPAEPETSVTGAGYTLGAGTALTTDAAGEATFAGLPVGVYVVQETGHPSTTTPAAPFLVTIPMTDPTNHDNWLYDVHVYPKNSVLEPTEKTVEDADDVKLGDEIDFTIVSDIPNEQVIDAYKIVDPLDSKLDYVPGSVTVAFQNSAQTLVEGVDYEVVAADGPYINAAGVQETRFTVTVRFLADGLLKLAANNADQVVVGLTTTVNTVGEILNQAYTYPNEGSNVFVPGNPDGPPPGETITKWGGLTLHKVGMNGTSLTGAVFQVFTSAADAAARTNPVTLGGTTSFEVVNADGTLSLSGLRYSDWANGAAVAPDEAGYIQYYLVEVEAPAGYELLAQPIEFTIDAATTATGIDLEVTNVPKFTLPFTGGAGAGMFYTLGLLLVGGGALFLIVARVRARRIAHA